MAFVDLGDQFVALESVGGEPVNAGHIGLVVDDAAETSRARSRFRRSHGRRERLPGSVGQSLAGRRLPGHPVHQGAEGPRRNGARPAREVERTRSTSSARRALPTDGVKRTVLVTGASSGIGEACAIRLARAGWHVYGGVRTPEAADSLRERGIEPLDARRHSRTRCCSAAAAMIGGTLEGLVDNAGIAIAAPLELVPLDELRRQLEVNVVGQVAVTQAFLPALRRARGRIVLMGSIGGRSALPFLGPYAASKHALEAIADSLRVELRPWGSRSRSSSPRASRRRSGRRAPREPKSSRAGFAPDIDELYAPAVASFRKVALSRGPGADPDDVAKAVEHALTAGASQGALRRRARCADTRGDRTPADATPRSGAGEGADRLAQAATCRGRRSRASRGRSGASRARSGGGPCPSPSTRTPRVAATPGSSGARRSPRTRASEAVPRASGG